jgi:hypothetical protein
MRLITHLPDAATARHLEYLLLLAARAVKKTDCAIVQEIKIAGQLGFKIGAIAERTKTGYSVRTWVEDLL